MNLSARYQNFIDRTARKPSGVKGMKLYNDPKSHYKGFDAIMEKLNLQNTDEYIEIGCGGGILLRMVLQKVKKAAALDHSADMVELSKENNAEYVESGQAEILQGDAAKLPWKDNSFTTAASAHMFFFVEKPEQVLSEIYRVLKPRGRFALVTMNNNILGKLAFGILYQLRTYSNRKMTGLLTSAGFKDIEVKSKCPFSQICFARK